MEIVLKCMRKHSVLGFLVTCLQVSSSKQHLLKKITYNDRIDGIGSDSFCCCLLTLNVFIFFVLMTYDLLVETADTSILEWFCSAAAVGLEAVRQSTRQPLTYDQFMDFRRKTEANRHGWFQPKAKKKKLPQPVSVIENCTVMGMTGSPRGPRVTRGDGGKLHGLAAGMGAKNTGSPRGWAQ